MSSIDPIQPGRPTRRSGQAASDGASDAARIDGPEGIDNLPVPVGPPRTVPRSPAPSAAANFAAHLLGQDGQKRGLRAGPGLIDTARHLYTRVEWSGDYDRRSRKGQIAQALI